MGRTSKMNVLVASRVRWTIAISSWTSAARRGRVAIEEALDDLGLEHDVREALGRPVVHRPGDVAAEVLLGGEDHPADAGRGGRGDGRAGTRPVVGSRSAGIASRASAIAATASRTRASPSR